MINPTIADNKPKQVMSRVPEVFELYGFEWLKSRCRSQA